MHALFLCVDRTSPDYLSSLRGIGNNVNAHVMQLVLVACVERLSITLAHFLHHLAFAVNGHGRRLVLKGLIVIVHLDGL